MASVKVEATAFVTFASCSADMRHLELAQEEASSVLDDPMYVSARRRPSYREVWCMPASPAQSRRNCIGLTGRFDLPFRYDAPKKRPSLTLQLGDGDFQAKTKKKLFGGKTVFKVKQGDIVQTSSLGNYCCVALKSAGEHDSP